jgi:hypothetical protein
VLREHRGDGHLAALVLAGLDPVEALLTAVATGASKKFLQSTRGWSPDQWAAGADRLRDRGLLTDDGTLSPAGTALRAEVEARTDSAAEAPYRRLGSERTTRLLELVRSLARVIADSGILPRSLAGQPKP